MPVGAGVVAAAVLRLLGVANTVVLVCLALVVFVTGTIVLDFYRASRARRRTGGGWLEATWGLLHRQNRRYGGFVIHLGILAVGVAGSQAWSVQTETSLERGQSMELAGYHIRFDGSSPPKSRTTSRSRPPSRSPAGIGRRPCFIRPRSSTRRSRRPSQLPAGQEPVR